MDEAAQVVDEELAARIMEWKEIVRAAKQRAQPNPTHKVIAEMATSYLKDSGETAEIKPEVCAQWFSRPPKGGSPLLKSNARVPGRAPLCWALIRALDALGGWKWQPADHQETEMHRLTSLLGLPEVPTDWPITPPASGANLSKRETARGGISGDAKAAAILRDAFKDVLIGRVPGLLCVRAFSPLLGALSQNKEFRQVLVEFVLKGGSYAVFTPTPRIPLEIDPGGKCRTLILQFNEIFDTAKDLVIALRHTVSHDKKMLQRIQLVQPCIKSKETRLPHMISWAPIPIEKEQRPCLFISSAHKLPTQDEDVVRMLRYGNWFSDLADQKPDDMFFQAGPEIQASSGLAELKIQERKKAHYEALRSVFLAWDQTDRQSLGETLGASLNPPSKEYRQAWCYEGTNCVICQTQTSREPEPPIGKEFSAPVDGQSQRARGAKNA